MRTVKRLRLEKGWSQKDLADKSGVGQDTISGIESGKHEPRPSTLRKLAEALDAEVVDFFSEPEEMAERPKVEESVSLEQWLDERCGHSHLAMSFDELAQFIKDAEDLDEQLERRKLLREELDVVVAERKRFPVFAELEIGGVPFEEIHGKWIASLFVSVELRRVTPEEAAQEVQKVQKLAMA